MRKLLAAAQKKKEEKLLSEKPASFCSTSMDILNSKDEPDALTICMTVKCQLELHATYLVFQFTSHRAENILGSEEHFRVNYQTSICSCLLLECHLDFRCF